MAQVSVPAVRQFGVPPILPEPLQFQSAEEVETFSTPPSTPPGRQVLETEPWTDRDGPHLNEDMNEEYFVPNTESIQLLGKRPHPDDKMFPIPRKMSREDQGGRAAEIYGVNHLVPTFPNGAFDQRRSFDAASRITADTRTTASTTLTTPNTSFCIDSAATSFGAPTDDDTAETHLEPWMDAMDLAVESPHWRTSVNMGPVDPRNNPVPQPGRLDTTEYLRKHLEAQSPFSEC